MLNVRKLKQDFSQNVLKEGKKLFDEKKVFSAQIIHLGSSTVRISAKIRGQFENSYQSEIEIDRIVCQTIDSDCDCPYQYDCQHLAALLFYLEKNLDEMLVQYSKENDLDVLVKTSDFNDQQKEELLEAVKQAVSKEEKRQDEKYSKELLQEYVTASSVLSCSPFFLVKENLQVDKAEVAIIFLGTGSSQGSKSIAELQIALRLPSRSKPLHVSFVRDFLDSVRHEEPLFMGGKRYFFTLHSFKEETQEIVRMLVDYSRVYEKPTTERGCRSAFMEMKSLGLILAKSFELSMVQQKKLISQEGEEEELCILPCIYDRGVESPMRCSRFPVLFHIALEYIQPPFPKILINPSFSMQNQKIGLKEVKLFECLVPGLIHNHIYYRFSPQITRQHLIQLAELQDAAIPEPLFGTFVEASLPELSKHAQIANISCINQFATIPFVGELRGVCDVSFIEGELDISLKFIYDGKEIPVIPQKLNPDHLQMFIQENGILERNLVEERRIFEDLVRDFVYQGETYSFVSRSEKKIVEFMTETIPSYQHRIQFNCPQNLLDQFVYDKTEFGLNLLHMDRMDVYELHLKVKGDLHGVRLDQLWECLLSKRSYLERTMKGPKQKKETKIPKILVLNLDQVGKIVHLFQELGIEKLEDQVLVRPLWGLSNVEKAHMIGLPIDFSMSDRLVNIRKQMLGEVPSTFSELPKTITKELRQYQIEGVRWLERLRIMYLNGILADDMGLGKTLQAIVALTQYYERSEKKNISLVICPTSLLYNWQEEIEKGQPHLKTIVIDGIPSQRKKMIEEMSQYDVAVTSYSLLQKDIEQYLLLNFAYVILDEAQYIKNRGTRNAKSVKRLRAEHRLILSGTPIENSLEELWSLFDFLMPGFLGTYDRFMEKYIRSPKEEQQRNLEFLRKKVSPFILRRMKGDVLQELPPLTEIVYRCQLKAKQWELYRSYAASAKDKLSKLVAKDGFDKAQIHVLAALTRLKQICCHPAIFAKEDAEVGDSAKYELFLEILQTLIGGGHKIVVFSQYAKMLQIMKQGLEERAIRFSHLDGTSKNRLDIVKQFNEDEAIPVFLVSLKAGGAGLNLHKADTVIHYDFWWNPAVENQATDRVYRMGQTHPVIVCKFMALDTIEEKILKMQKRKKGIVKKIVDSDDDIFSRLTWDDVLELLQI